MWCVHWRSLAFLRSNFYLRPAYVQRGLETLDDSLANDIVLISSHCEASSILSYTKVVHDAIMLMNALRLLRISLFLAAPSVGQLTVVPTDDDLEVYISVSCRSLSSVQLLMNLSEARYPVFKVYCITTSGE